MSVAFGVRQSDGTGTTDTDIRMMLAHKWASTGIVGGLAVEGSPSGLTYSVSPGMAVCSKGASDGFTEAYFPGGATPEVAANAGGNPRIDVVWVTSHDASQGDADNLVTLGVTQGAAARVPVEPDVPTYATKLAAMLVPAGSATTGGASVSSLGRTAVPHGASLGVLADKRDTSSADVTSSYTAASAQVAVPTARLLLLNLTFTLVSVREGGGDSTVYVSVTVDGERVGYMEVHAFRDFATSQFFQMPVEVEAGEHTVALRVSPGVGTCRRYYSNGGWAGQRMQVVDGGAA